MGESKTAPKKEAVQATPPSQTNGNGESAADAAKKLRAVVHPGAGLYGLYLG